MAEEEVVAAANDWNGPDLSDAGDYTSEYEGTEDYRRGGYHAVRFGDTFMHGRYIVQSKLGTRRNLYVLRILITPITPPLLQILNFGSNNYTFNYEVMPNLSAWEQLRMLCVVNTPICVALKFQRSAQHYTEAAMDEITILKQISDGDQDEKKCVVKLLDHFKHSSPNWQHVSMRNLLPYPSWIGLSARQLSIIHTDLKSENILLLSMMGPSKEDPRKSGAPLILASNKDKCASKSETSQAVKSSHSGLAKNKEKKFREKAGRTAHKCVGNEASEEAEPDNEESGPDDSLKDGKSNGELLEEQSKTSNSDGAKTASDGTRANRRFSQTAKQKLLTEVDLKCTLVDFVNACWTFKQFTNVIQTRQCRCPEVILGSKYSTSADMWSLACICFELATGVVLFDPHSGENYDHDEDHLALMMELLGMMPHKVALGRRYSREFFNRFRDLRHIKRLRFWPLNKVFKEKYVFNEHDANEMADFLVHILDFVPEKRPPAAQCLNHPWIIGGPLQTVPSVSQLKAVENGRSEKDEREAVEVAGGSKSPDGVAISAKKIRNHY